MTYKLWDRKSNGLVQAELLPEMTAAELVKEDEVWKKFRDAKASGLRSGMAPPEHHHWNWERKSHELKFTAYRCLGIRCKGEIQGMMMVSTLAAGGRSAANKRKPILYLKYIESAPWNLKAYVGEEARFGGVGVALICAAIEVSVEEEFKGRIGLHSLPQSEQFYARFMSDLGVDIETEGLRYFEMSEEQARKFLKGGNR